MDNQEDQHFRKDGLIFSGHPNPAWARRKWLSLDGIWKLSQGGREEEIRVPFPIGSEASGVDFRDSGDFVYSRSFDCPDLDESRRHVLHIGACDYEATAFLNGKRLGFHRGGYASFSFDLGDSLKARGNSLEIRVRDSHRATQCRGKQTFRKGEWFVWYEGIAGIWQPVWIEETGADHVERASLRADFATRRVEIMASVIEGRKGGEARPGQGKAEGLRLEAEVRSESGILRKIDASPLGTEQDGPAAFGLSFSFDEIGGRLWSPERPELYALTYRLYRGEELCDTVESYFGLRSVEAAGGGLRLNGKSLYLRMVLDQGYYPGGVYTPLTREVYERDIATMKSMGYNGARIHEKIESPYFHYLCDRMGFLTSCEMPSFYRAKRRALEAYEGELKEIMARDSMHPSCVMLMLFNETWGIWGIYRKGSRTRRFVERMVALARKENPGRPVIENSGWDHFDTDIVDFHHYLGTAALARELYGRMSARDESVFHGFKVSKVLNFYLRNTIATETRNVFLEPSAEVGDKPLFLSEYGGFGWYETSDKGSVIEKIGNYTRDIVDSGVFCGYCLTQFCDVGGEVNGLLTFDRRPKVDLERMREINSYISSASS